MQPCISVSSSFLLAVLAGCAAPTLAPPDHESTPGDRHAAASASTDPVLARTVAAAVPQNGNRNLPGQGDFEVLLTGSGSNDEDFEVGSGAANIGVGYYLTDALELVVRQSGSFLDAAPGEDDWNGASRAGLDFNFVGAPLIPYIGVEGGYVYGDSINDTWTAGPEGGLKWYIKDEAFLQLGVEYAFFFDETEMVDEAFKDGTFIYTVGFGLRF